MYINLEPHASLWYDLTRNGSALRDGCINRYSHADLPAEYEQMISPSWSLDSLLVNVPGTDCSNRVVWQKNAEQAFVNRASAGSTRCVLTSSTAGDFVVSISAQLVNGSVQGNAETLFVDGEAPSVTITSYPTEPIELNTPYQIGFSASDNRSLAEIWGTGTGIKDCSYSPVANGYSDTETSVNASMQCTWTEVTESLVLAVRDYSCYRLGCGYGWGIKSFSAAVPLQFAE